MGPGEIKPFKKILPRMLASGSEHTLMLDYNNNLYSWGKNTKGQLGVGHSNPIKSIVN